VSQGLEKLKILTKEGVLEPPPLKIGWTLWYETQSMLENYLDHDISPIAKRSLTHKMPSVKMDSLSSQMGRKRCAQ
jgi:hypothetical protein